jgi:hypothetical protein
MARTYNLHLRALTCDSHCYCSNPFTILPHARNLFEKATLRPCEATPVLKHGACWTATLQVPYACRQAAVTGKLP